MKTPKFETEHKIIFGIAILFILAIIINFLIGNPLGLGE
jgi:hypothetical protein